MPFNKAYIAGKELYYIAQAVAEGELKGDGPFTKRCQRWLEATLGAPRAFLTHSCTAALEMAALLLDVDEGDEIIMPSYTFVSTANAFVLRGAAIKFVDIREDTLNLDEKQISGAISRRTKAIVPVHYAGVACEMESICSCAKRAGAFVVEDAAHAVLAGYRGRRLGTFGDLGTLSFHETKNFSAGEAGALLVNNEEFVKRAEIIWEKGTNRSSFFRGEVAKYTWVDIGSSYLPSELVSAFLYGQFEQGEEITKRRLQIWHTYRELLAPLEEEGFVRLPCVPAGCEINGHLFYLLLESEQVRGELIAFLEKRGINAVFHYIPLHLSPMGERLGYRKGMLPVTERIAATLLRLPIYYELSRVLQEEAAAAIAEFFHGRPRK